MNQQFKKRAAEILQKYQDGTATQEEQLIVKKWFAASNFSVDSTVTSPAEQKELLEKIKAEIAIKQQRTVRLRLWQYGSVAAALIIGLSAIGYFTLYRNDPKNTESIVLTQDVPSARNMAVVELADGRKVLLDAGNLANTEDLGAKVDGQKGIISFLDEKSNSTSQSDIQFNTVSTTDASQYTVILPDGSVVKLNTNSSIRFPNHFSDKRNVEVEGEAFFDVKRDETKKFIVNAKYQQIEVLGTQFNVKSYKEEKTTSTALISGSLLVASKVDRFRQSQIIKPGQMALNGADEPLTIHSTNIEKERSFQKGEFHFDGENLEEILAILSRWYNVKFIYDFTPSREARYGGIVSRDKNLSTVLNLLEDREKLQFTIKGKEVFVSKKKN